MKVICIDIWSEVDGYSFDTCKGLTRGKSYDVISQYEEFYIIEDDKGSTTNYFKWRFKVSTRENKLKRILK